MAELRKYGAATTVLFPLVDRGTVDFESTPVSFVAADSQISKDEGAFNNTTNSPAHEGNGIYSLALTATEMQAARVVVTIIDSATKTWEDQAVIIDTYGNASAQHAVDLDDGVRAGLTALPNAAADAAGGLPISDAGGLDLDTMDSNVSAVLTDTGTSGVLLAATATSAQLVDDVWDEALTSGAHNVSNSGARRLRFIQEGAIYSDGAIYIDTVNGAAGTTDYENGTPSNPTNSIANANTLATSLGITKFVVLPGSSITFAATQSNQSFIGENWTLALGGQNIAGTYIKGAVVSGTGTGSGATFETCEIGTCTLADCSMSFCRFTGTLTFSAASDYYFSDCYSGVSGAGTPTIDFGAAVANTNLSMRRYSGGVQIENKDATGTDQMSLEGNGQLVVAASSGGAISIRGNFRVTNTGGATITYDDNTANIAAVLVDTGTTLDNHLTDIKGTGFAKDTHSLTNIEGYADLIDDGTSGLAKIATDVAAVLVDTADMQPKLGSPAGASISADIAAVKTDTAATLVDTGTSGVLLAATATSAQLVDDVWDEDVDTSHQTAGTAGKKLDDAGAAADPWSTALPGSYGAGTAGKIVGTNLDAQVSNATGANVSVQALASQNNTSPVPDTTVTLYEDTALPNIVLTITDSDGDAVDVSGDTLNFIIYDVDNTALFTLSGASITVSGSGNNTVTIAYTTTTTANPLTGRWELRNVASGSEEVRGRGPLNILSPSESP